LERLQCVNNCRELSWSASSFQPVVDNENLCFRRIRKYLK